MPNSNLKEQLASLHQLQQVDLNILELHQQLQDVPLKIKELENRLQVHEQQLKEKKEALSEAEKEQRSKSAELQMEQEQRGKYEAQLREVKTNKEYQALDKEISFLQQKEAEIEDAILEGMLQIDQLNDALREQETAFNAEQAKNRAQKDQYEQEAADLKAQILEQQEGRKRLLPTTDHDLMNRYRAWFKRNRTGLVAVVTDNACSSCRMAIPPQMLKEARKYEQIVLCASCKRILYAQPPASADEPPTDEAEDAS
jgi:predicted  nucleic acid-binding Zn-ribbon protein